MDSLLLSMIVIVLPCLVLPLTSGYPLQCKAVGEDCSGETGAMKTCIENCDEYGVNCKLECVSDDILEQLQRIDEWKGTGIETGHIRVKRQSTKTKIKIKSKSKGKKVKVVVKQKKSEQVAPTFEERQPEEIAGGTLLAGEEVLKF